MWPVYTYSMNQFRRNQSHMVKCVHKYVKINVTYTSLIYIAAAVICVYKQNSAITLLQCVMSYIAHYPLLKDA